MSGRVDELVVVAMDAVAQAQPTRLRGHPDRPHDLPNLRAPAEEHPAPGHPGQNVARVAVELERARGSARRIPSTTTGASGATMSRMLTRHGRPSIGFAATGAAGGYVIGDDRGDPDAVEFHRGRIVAGRRQKGVSLRSMDDHEDDLPPSEAARQRRRDRDAEAGARAGMKSGLAKQFKQVLDTQVKRARESERKATRDPERSERPDGRASGAPPGLTRAESRCRAACLRHGLQPGQEQDRASGPGFRPMWSGRSERRTVAGWSGCGGHRSRRPGRSPARRSRPRRRSRAGRSGRPGPSSRSASHRH